LDHAAVGNLDLARIRRLDGFGGLSPGDGYLFEPTSLDELRSVVLLAEDLNVPITLRGSGRSYGDTSSPLESVTISLARMNRVLAWDKESGVIEAEGGATLEAIWQYVLQDGWWFNVVSGTMKPTLAGAVSTNIHGKNNLTHGTFAEHVEMVEIMLASGEVRQLVPSQPEFWAVHGGLGLLGIVTKVRFRLKKVSSGNVRVVQRRVQTWADHFELFETFADADYSVSWVNGFTNGSGVFQAAWHGESSEPETLDLRHQRIEGKLAGLIHRDTAWKHLRRITNRPGMKLASTLKSNAARIAEGAPKIMSLVQYNFPLDYLPNWQRAYVPNGLLQFQAIVPTTQAEKVFNDLTRRWRGAKLEPYLVVLKKHRPDETWLRYLDHGFSLALDFRQTPRNVEALNDLYNEMAEVVLNAGGRFYFAKDGLLSPAQAKRSLGEAGIARFTALRDDWDPKRRFKTQLSCRIGLDECVQYARP